MKEKIIAEMQQELISWSIKQNLHFTFDTTWKHAEVLYNAGYRKLPEGAVVLSKEEYDEIKIYKSYIPEMKKAFDKVRNATLEMCKNEIEYWKNRCEEIGDVAVRNILAELKQALIINNEENTEFFDYDYTLETIDDFAKQYEVKNGKQNNK